MTLRDRLGYVVAVSVLVAGCGTAGTSPEPSSSSGGTEDPLRVVATTTVFADIVSSIGGDYVTVDSIVPAGAGPEDFEPRPEDVRRLAEAELVVSNGVGLDDFLDDAIQAAGTDPERLVLGDEIPSITIDGEENPHFWLDPSLVERFYVPAIRDTLVRLRPGATVAITRQADGFAARLRELDGSSRRRLATIPQERRKLVTFHDAFPYFAAHYDFDQVGVILENPGQEPSAAELAALVVKVREADVPAVFSEAQFDAKLARTLAEEAGVTEVVTTLYTDTLGPPPADSYEGLMTWNVDEIVRALS
jgi:zinc/manganese transport system substrate-binding protein/manganese/iron transport system substrate-binding protein